MENIGSLLALLLLSSLSIVPCASQHCRDPMPYNWTQAPHDNSPESVTNPNGTPLGFRRLNLTVTSVDEERSCVRVLFNNQTSNYLFIASLLYPDITVIQLNPHLIVGYYRNSVTTLVTVTIHGLSWAMHTSVEEVESYENSANETCVRILSRPELTELDIMCTDNTSLFPCIHVGNRTDVFVEFYCGTICDPPNPIIFYKVEYESLGPQAGLQSWCNLRNRTLPTSLLSSGTSTLATLATLILTILTAALNLDTA